MNCPLRHGWLGIGLACGIAWSAGGAAPEKVTFEDHVLPIFRASCLKCHNPDKLKGDLDLTTVASTLKGGGSGAGVVSGDPEASKLFRAITHTEEPNMPPNSGKIPDTEIELIRRWIAGGLLEGSSAGKDPSAKPKKDMVLPPASAGRPAGLPPMPQDALLEPVTHTARTSVSTALAHSPWAPLAALGGQKQVLLYDTDSLELAAVLPFPEGMPQEVKFSRNGMLVLVGGGHASRSGIAALWDVATGNRVATVGDEFDTVLTADLSADQKWIALGGPGRLVKLYATKEGALQHRLKKHTDWVTALEFSPNSRWLASGDRNGGLQVWDAAEGQEQSTLTGHKAAITSVCWRADSESLVSSSEDGTVKIWKAAEGLLVKSWPAHPGGVLWVRSAHDGRLVSCGRDRQIVIWDADGGKQRAISLTNEFAVRVDFSHDGKRILGSDWSGTVTVWNAADGARVGPLSLNPPTLLEQTAAATQRAAEMEAAVGRLSAAHAALDKEWGQAQADLAGTVKTAPQYKELGRRVEVLAKQVRERQEAVRQAQVAAEKARRTVGRLTLAQVYVGVLRARREWEEHRQAQDQRLTELANHRAAAEQAAKEIGELKTRNLETKQDKSEQSRRIKTLGETMRTAQAKAEVLQGMITKSAPGLILEQARVEKLTAEYQRMKAELPTLRQAAQLQPK